MIINKKRVVILIVIALIIGIVSITAISALIENGDSRYSSNGERIYYTGINEDGEEISYVGGTMMRLGCADCHGGTGEGGLNIMMSDVTSTDIRYDILTGVDGIENESEEEHHDSHIPYNDTTIKTAITLGLEPDGEQLNSAMPRWRMSDEDLDDLLGYLKTLNSTNTNTTQNTSGNGMMGGNGMVGGTMGFGWIFVLVLIGLLVFLFSLLFNRDKGSPQQSSNGRDITMDMLDQRYGSGEISRKKYLRIKKDLGE